MEGNLIYETPHITDSLTISSLLFFVIQVYFIQLCICIKRIYVLENYLIAKMPGKLS